MYAFDLEPLFDALKQIGASNAQGEYTCPISCGSTGPRNLSGRTVTVEDSREVLGREQPEGAGRRGGNHQAGSETTR